MTELYSIPDVAKLFALQESRLRYWMQTGFVGPTVRKQNRFYYTFRDLCAVKAAKDLLAAGLSAQKVRKNLEALRRSLPGDAHPALKLRVCSDGENVVALADDVAFVPATGQVVMAFNLPALGGQVESLRQRQRERAAEEDAADGAPQAIVDDATEATLGPSAYTCFIEACAAEDRGDLGEAEALYARALDLDPHLAAAMTNLGNLRHRAGAVDEARRLYERALEHDPSLAEARYNLGNLLEDLGETDLAIAELCRVTQQAPDFADAHYNLGLALVRLGSKARARRHLHRYLELDASSEWASRAREYLAQVAA
ncbi:MAG: tetratricopeptide repeat protein [Kofleriaceae bacterium]|nr:tetratricopeptide repeat protein [Kofleriaceae bacterium]MCL4226377.1 tetratricopeptide repeat protein [Myxococcales bacterium]